MPVLGGSLFVGRWTFRRGEFKASVSMTASSEASLTSDSTAPSTVAHHHTNMRDSLRRTGSVTERSQSVNDWPWMKGTKCRIENPIAHVDPYDKRPTVKSLISKHRKEIDELRSKIEDHHLFNSHKHDDLWLMRFLFSHRMNQQAALDAATNTLEFRHEYALDEWDIRHVQPKSENLHHSDYPYAHAAAKMLDCYDAEDTMIYYVPDPKRGVVGFLHLAGRNQHRMAETLSQQDYFEAHLFSTEWKFQWLDYLTRSTGLMTKYLSVADCIGSHRGMINKHSKHMDSAAAKTMEDKYPQLLGSMFVVNAPIWINVVFAIIKPFIPKRLLEKINLIKPLKRERDLELLQEYISMSDLPERYGGLMKQWPPPDPSMAF